MLFIYIYVKIELLTRGSQGKKANKNNADHIFWTLIWKPPEPPKDKLTYICILQETAHLAYKYLII